MDDIPSARKSEPCPNTGMHDAINADQNADGCYECQEQVGKNRVHDGAAITEESCEEYFKCVYPGPGYATPTQVGKWSCYWRIDDIGWQDPRTC